MYLYILVIALLQRAVRGQNSTSSNATLLVDPDVYPGASQICLDALSYEPNCNPIVYALYGSYYTSIDLETLADLCRDSCFTSLQAHQANVSSACEGIQYYDESSGSYYPPDFLDLQAISGFNLTCIQDGSEYCETYFQNVTGQEPCDYCQLKSLQTKLNEGLAGEDEDLASSFSSLTQSCSSTQFSTTIPSAVALTTSAAPAPTCAGYMYTIKPGDTMYSVSESQKVATDTLLNRNGLSYESAGFPTNGTVCIGAQCDVHVLQINETCAGIAAASDISTVQLLSWNTNINPLCTNLNLFVNGTVCISNPLGNFTIPINTVGNSTVATTAAPQPTNVGPNTTTDCGMYYETEPNDDCQIISAKFNIQLTDFYFLNPEINVNCTNLWANTSYCVEPVGSISTYPGYGGSTTSSIQPASTTSLIYTAFGSIFANPTGVAIPIANDTRTDCAFYKWIYNSTAIDCWGWATAYGITNQELVLWNPSLNPNPETFPSSFNYTCTLATSASYCVGLAYSTATATSTTPPSPRASGEISDCTNWFTLTGAQTCSDVLSNTGLTIAEFYQMNPSVNADCSGMDFGTYYCYSSPSVEIVTNSSSTTSVVSVSATTTSSSAPTATTGANGIPTPTPVQAGMTTNCDLFHDVIANDGCYNLAAHYNITLDDFYAWNPAVKDDCSGLDTGFYVCVGIVSSATSTSPTSTTATTTSSATGIVTPTPHQANMISGCTTFYEAVANDSCDVIASKNGITATDVETWNPDVGGTACTGVWPDYYYCVGI